MIRFFLFYFTRIYRCKTHACGSRIFCNGFLPSSENGLLPIFFELYVCGSIYFSTRKIYICQRTLESMSFYLQVYFTPQNCFLQEGICIFFAVSQRRYSFQRGCPIRKEFFRNFFFFISSKLSFYIYIIMNF